MRIKFSQVNFRYLVFNYKDKFFLFDRYPVNLLCFIFLPMSWIFTQNCYEISKETYQNLRTLNQENKSETISITFITSLIIFLSSIFKKIIYLLEVDFGFSINLLILLFIVLADILLINLWSKREFNKVSENYPQIFMEKQKVKIRLDGYKKITKLMFLYLMIYFIAAVSVWIELKYGNYFFMIGSGIIIFIVLLLAFGSFNEGAEYKVRLLKEI
ncbi:tandem five-transmembrane protein [Streptococcus sp. 45]|uniref:DUF443 family protein n=1 Tax=Streptococcus TaxID=1301 RepID=UPI00087185FB|nr:MULTISPECIES: DUF443 family protein [Streptococcus]MCR5492919.1 DUF443 family protein [Streptococcus sp.]SCW35473.1 tandem five-transmembrane protein [Streptococcus equinus]SDI70853.1 tandem five-transmembrane protein [Streptococcus equinus]SEI46364.1 tandem five-transmembrane protein [Streptococcus sp. 45]SEP73776.1 tandem five-transmembrane protein [Streptococcus equinus]